MNVRTDPDFRAEDIGRVFQTCNRGRHRNQGIVHRSDAEADGDEVKGLRRQTADGDSEEAVPLDRGRPVRMQARRLRSQQIVRIAVAEVGQLKYLAIFG